MWDPGYFSLGRFGPSDLLSQQAGARLAQSQTNQGGETNADPSAATPRDGRSLSQVGSRWFLGSDVDVGPEIKVFDSYGSQQVVRSTLRSISRYPGDWKDALVTGESDNDYRIARDGVETIQSAFANVSKTIGVALNARKYLGLSASVDWTAVQTAPGDNSTPGQYAFQVTSIARPHIITSDVQSDSETALGLSGTLTIGEAQITITASDTLQTIAAKINQDEDQDDDNLLDTTEDLNGNDVLDSGAKASGVIARVTDNQLILESVNSGSVPFSIQSDDGVAEALGLIETGGENSLRYKNVLQTGLDTTILYGDQTVTSSQNRISGLPGDLTLEINPSLVVVDPSADSPQSFTVQVSVDPASVHDAIGDFVDSHNRAMDLFNRALMYPGTLDSDTTLFYLRANMVDALNATRMNNTSVRNIGDMGVDMVSSRRVSVPELALTQVEKRLSAKQPSSLGEAVDSIRSLVGSLRTLGILDRKDGLLEINESRLNTALTERRSEVNSLLASNDQGVLTRLKNLIDEANAEPAGAFPSRIDFYNGQLATIDQREREKDKFAELFREQLKPASSNLGNLLDMTT